MKIGIFTVLFSQMDLVECLKRVKQAGIDAVEIGTGNYPGAAHCPLDELLASDKKCKEYKKVVLDHGLEIAALSCHGNPLHPDPGERKMFQQISKKTLRLAEKLGVKTVVDFSGCPGDHQGAKFPNWVTCPWPEDFSAVLQWQWEEEVIPYWKSHVQFARDHGVKRIALEMHPGFVVYNPETLLKLRKAAGPIVGANLDPSHLFWQGIDPLLAVRELQGAIYHVHAKDTRIDALNTAVNGVLDTKSYRREGERSWIFRTVGYGHDAQFWKDFVSALRVAGYDGVLSIEHEDSLMSAEEGFLKAAAFLNNLILKEKPGAMWWA